MPESSATVKLEKRIERYFEHYSSKRIALAAGVVGMATLVSALLVYLTTQNGFATVGAFLVVGLISVNGAMLMIVPPTRQLTESRSLLINAVQQPSLIKRVDRKVVMIADKKGKVHTLRKYEQRAWDQIVTPFFFNASASRGRVIRQALEAEKQGNKLEAMEARRKELEAQESKFQEAQKRLESERAEMDRRSQELMDAENMVIERLSQVELAEAQMAQLKEDLDSAMNRQSTHGTGSVSDAVMKEKEAELKAKESEIEALKRDLLEDRQIVSQQKTELNQMKGEILRDLEKATGGTVNAQDLDAAQLLQQKLDARARELEAAARELDERSRYVDEAEESLVQRLGQLTEREAHLQQGEINAGLRRD